MSPVLPLLRPLEAGLGFFLSRADASACGHACDAYVAPNGRRRHHRMLRQTPCAGTSKLRSVYGMGRHRGNVDASAGAIPHRLLEPLRKD